MKLITDIDGLPPPVAASATADERAFIKAIKGRGFLPFAVTPFYASLAGTDRADPIRRQFFPDPRETIRAPYECADPLGESHHRVAPRLVHQYGDRALLLSSGSCAGYCRHCFRRVWTGEERSFIAEDELALPLAYLASHPGIKEILVSGGDPLIASDDRLEWLFAALRKARPGILLRLCTRVPVVDPRRIDDSLAAMLRKFRPLRVILHLNPPRELPQEVRDALSRLVDSGIPVHTQTVLLRGINDDVQLLAGLFRELTDLGATPYYLFQGDLAPGTAHFRVPLARGMELYAALRRCCSPLSLPIYAVDLPGGGGKLHLTEASLHGEERDADGRISHILRRPDGTLWRYPKED